jgi:hypothetical protein
LNLGPQCRRLRPSTAAAHFARMISCALSPICTRVQPGRGRGTISSSTSSTMTVTPKWVCGHCRPSTLSKWTTSTPPSKLCGLWRRNGQGGGLGTTRTQRHRCDLSQHIYSILYAMALGIYVQLCVFRVSTPANLISPQYVPLSNHQSSFALTCSFHMARDAGGYLCRAQRTLLKSVRSKLMICS